MKVVFMGTPDFAVPCLRSIVEAWHELLLVVTQPDRPKGRHGAAQKSPVRIEAEAQGIPVITPERLRQDEEAKERIRASAPDVIVVVAFGQLLPPDVLAIPRLGCINVHASLLPKYRGASPIQWAILNGDRETGVTTMLMDEGLDTGDILLQSVLPLQGNETGGSLFSRLSIEGGRLLRQTLEALERGGITPRKQEEGQASKVGMLSKGSGRIDWNKSAVELERMVRGLNPWPSAYTYLNGKRLILWEAEVMPYSASDLETVWKKQELNMSWIDEQDTCLFYVANADWEKNKAAQARLSPAQTGQGQEGGSPDGEGREDPKYDYAVPGAIYTNYKRLCFLTGDGFLEAKLLQLEGKKRMDPATFLQGHHYILTKPLYS